MSIITKIETQKNNESRVNIYLDDKFFAGVSLDNCIKFRLKKDMEISSEELEQLILEEEKSIAFNKALNYLSSSLKTRKQIREYLKKKEYNEFTIDYVIAKLEEYKYLDDENYVKAFVLTYSRKYGKLKLKNALKSKGISEKIIDNYFEENELNCNILSVATKYLKNKEINNANLMKLNRFLYSRGYEYDEISSCIDAIKRGELC